jgi:hypothetical protein
MNRNLLRGVLPAFAALLAGCASDQLQVEFQPKPISVPPPTLAPPPRPTASEVLRQAAAQPSAPFAGEGWRSLSDGKTLTGWRVTAFAGAGQVECRDGLIALWMGDPFTGIGWTNEPPEMDYEIALDAMRVDGADFFCGLTFPVRDSNCSLIVGGWGGAIVGLSSLDGMDASENETTRFVNFERGRWYRIRLRVTEAKVEAWIDEQKVVDVEITGRRISVRAGDIEQSKPLGIASWMTAAALREIKLRRVSGPDSPPK